MLDNTDINLEMVSSGWSVFYVIAPYDKTAARKYSVAAKEAFENQRGLYSKEYSNTMLPYMFRMKYSGQKPHNLIGDIVTKKLFVPAKMESVPVYNRIFFPSLEMARLRGYNW
jgi:micrococcal nuclease